jgi:hypothetical protein
VFTGTGNGEAARARNFNLGFGENCAVDPASPLDAFMLCCADAR